MTTSTKPATEVSPSTPVGRPAARAGARHLRAIPVATGRRWNELVLALADADLRQSFEWGELPRDGGRSALRYAVYDGRVPVAAISATVWRRFGSPFSVLYASRGPVVGAHPDVWPGLLEAAADMARRTRAVLLRCSPPAPADDRELDAAFVSHGFIRLPDQWTLWNAPRVVMVLDLRRDETVLRRAMRESTRLSLGRLESAGGRVELDASEAAVGRLHRLLTAAGRRKGYPVRDLRFFLALRREYLARDQGCLALGRYGDRDLAGVLAVRFGRRAYLLYSAIDAGSEAARKLRAGAAVHWAVIRWAKAAGCEVLDWGGAGTGFPPSRQSAGHGIYEFKRGFGCSLVHLAAYYDLVFHPALYRVFRWVETRWAPSLWRLRARLNR
jgi:peptidoglycan pentaglycine glycine transferase (the first glycine)